MTNGDLNWNSIYGLLTGPALWFTFIFVIGGLLIRIAFLFRLSRRKDRVIYNHINMDWGLRSIIHWIIPFASVSMRQQPIFSLVAFIFHLTLIAVPLFLSAHILLWEEAFGLTLWSIPDGVSDALTLIFIAAALFLIVRRRIRPEVRILTGAWDYALLLIAAYWSNVPGWSSVIFRRTSVELRGPGLVAPVARALRGDLGLPRLAKKELRDIMLGHLSDMHRFYGEATGVRVARKHLTWYCQHLVDADEYRHRVVRVGSAEEQLRLTREYFEREGGGIAIAA